jgi:6-phosphogluconolactonase (cycloisomerase 2 family)
VALAVLALPCSLWAQGNFVYTNDNISAANTVSGFSVAVNGTLTRLSGSPFSTGGTGSEGGYYASNRITISADGKFLFATNDGSNNVSVFSINKKTGALTLVAGSPFATGGTATCGGYDCGISLAPTWDGKHLIAASGGSDDMTVFSIATTGALTPIVGSPFATAGSPDGIKVSPDNKFLVVAEPDINEGEIFSIASDGSLTSLGAGQAPSGGELTGVDANCFPRWVYGSDAAESTLVSGAMLSKSGGMTRLKGSPYEPGVGVNSNVVLIGNAGGLTIVFVSNQGSNTITVFTAAVSGALQVVPGAPFAMHAGANQPAGMASSSNGGLLYVANINGTISVFSVGSGGALKEVVGSPFSTGQVGGLESLTAFPPRTIPAVQVPLGGCYANAVQ